MPRWPRTTRRGRKPTMVAMSTGRLRRTAPTFRRERGIRVWATSGLRMNHAPPNSMNASTTQSAATVDTCVATKVATTGPATQMSSWLAASSEKSGRELLARHDRRVDRPCGGLDRRHREARNEPDRHRRRDRHRRERDREDHRGADERREHEHGPHPPRPHPAARERAGDRLPDRPCREHEAGRAVRSRGRRSMWMRRVSDSIPWGARATSCAAMRRATPGGAQDVDVPGHEPSSLRGAAAGLRPGSAR